MSENNLISSSDSAHARSEIQNTTSQCEFTNLVQTYHRLWSDPHVVLLCRVCSEYGIAPYSPESVARHFLSVSMLRPLLSDMFGDLLESERLISCIPSSTEPWENRQKYDVPGIPQQQRIVDTIGMFFREVFPDTYSQYGIVYTPVVVVDFILRSVNDVLQKEFGRSLSDEDVDVYDLFAGCGTFVARMYELGLSAPRVGIRCSEIDLFSHVVCRLNLRSASGVFDHNVTFGDAFQQQFPDAESKIRVFIGNPPYSTGRKSTGGMHSEQMYPDITRRVRETYIRDSAAKSKTMVHDAYVRAMRLVSDMVASTSAGGIVGFVVNGSWITARSMDGFRKHLAKDFSSIYVFNLRGNGRLVGKRRLVEGDTIFPNIRISSAIIILVRKPGWDSDRDVADIFYTEIGDYLNRDEKYAKIREFGSVLSPAMRMQWAELHTDVDGWWMGQCDPAYASFASLVPDVFTTKYPGIRTQGDALMWSFSRTGLEQNMTLAFSEYAACAQAYRLRSDPDTSVQDVVQEFGRSCFPWNKVTLSLMRRVRDIGSVDMTQVVLGMYRPFVRKHLYFDPLVATREYGMLRAFPDPAHRNLLISVSTGPCGFGAIVVDSPSCEGFMTHCTFVPLFVYHAYEREYAVSDAFLRAVQLRYGNPLITHEDIFYYVYGLLHSPEYRARYASEFERGPPRIPVVDESAFHVLAEAGRALAELHLHYEDAAPYPDVEVEIIDASELANVNRLSYRRVCATDPKTGKRSVVLDRSCIRLFSPKHKQRPVAVISGIPEKVHEYTIGDGGVINGLVFFYSAREDKRLGLTSQPDAWGNEHGNPRYILDLLLSMITVSMKTMEIMESLPREISSWNKFVK